MILDVLANRERYGRMHPRIGRALEYLGKTDFSAMADGRHPIDGDDLYALVLSYETEAEQERRFEAHRNYLDIQCILSGREIIYWAPTEELSALDDYSEEKDIVFLSGEARARLRLTAGSFAVFYPEDAHKPNCAWDEPQRARKVVVKVRVG
jgi:biofilm protein TabA